MTCEITLTHGQVALVDAADYEWLMQWKWRARANACWYGRNYYADSTVKIDGKWQVLKMHRIILGLEIGDKRHGDHINHDTLDNRRGNLRIVTPAENNRNRRRPLRHMPDSRSRPVHDGRQKDCLTLPNAAEDYVC